MAHGLRCLTPCYQGAIPLRAILYLIQKIKKKEGDGSRVYFR
jgi:hypothetical protein